MASLGDPALHVRYRQSYRLFCSWIQWFLGNCRWWDWWKYSRNIQRYRILWMNMFSGFTQTWAIPKHFKVPFCLMCGVNWRPWAVVLPITSCCCHKGLLGGTGRAFTLVAKGWSGIIVCFIRNTPLGCYVTPNLSPILSKSSTMMPISGMVLRLFLFWWIQGDG